MKKLSPAMLADRFWQETLAAGAGGALAALVFGQSWVALACLATVIGVVGYVARRAQREAADAGAVLEDLREDVNRHRKRAAYEDIETGLGTAKQLEISFTKQLARNQRWGEAFSLVVLEVSDAYKPDRRLQPVTAASIANGLLRVARSEDTVCRLDNWTFVVLLAGSARDGADAFVTRVRTRVSAVEHPGEPGDVFVTMRAGVSTWHEGVGAVVEMLTEADKDMKSFDKALHVERQRFEADEDPLRHAG